MILRRASRRDASQQELTMHDSRGAALKVGDRVMIEAEVTQVGTDPMNDYCNCTVKVITPEQTNRTPMDPPSLSAINTKMLTKVGGMGAAEAASVAAGDVASIQAAIAK